MQTVMDRARLFLMTILFLSSAACSRLTEPGVAEEFRPNLPAEEQLTEGSSASSSGGSVDEGVVGEDLQDPSGPQDGVDPQDGTDPVDGQAEEFQLLEESSNQWALAGGLLTDMAILNLNERNSQVMDLELVVHPTEQSFLAVALISAEAQSRIESIYGDREGRLVRHSVTSEDVAWMQIHVANENLILWGYDAEESQIHIRSFRFSENFFDQASAEWVIPGELPEYSVFDFYEEHQVLYFVGSEGERFTVRLTDFPGVPAYPKKVLSPPDRLELVLGGLVFDVMEEDRLRVFGFDPARYTPWSLRPSQEREFKSRKVDSLAWSAKKISGAPRGSEFMIFSETSGSELKLSTYRSPRLLDARKYYNYESRTHWQNAHAEVGEAFLLTIPKLLPVLEGSAGNHGLQLFIDDQLCHYRGSSDQSRPPRQSAQWDKGMTYYFVSCENGWRAGEQVRVEKSLRMSVQHGNPRSSPTRVGFFFSE